MDTIQEYDVVIVYEENIVEAASDTSYRGHTPFARKSMRYSYNETYEYFLQYCKRVGLRAAFASTADVIEGGSFSAVWVYNKKWKRVRTEATARIIFDKFSNREVQNAKVTALLEDNAQQAPLFHNSAIRELFDNKIKTYKKFTAFAIPTVTIDVESTTAIDSAKKRLKKIIQQHPHSTDFTNEFVLKDTYGAGGENVFKVSETKDIEHIGKQDTSIEYLLQPLIAASGFVFTTYRGNIDLRLIVCDGAVVQCYIRVPQEGGFKANASSGGEVVYIPLKEIPKGVLEMAKNINTRLPVKDAFYALDFIKSSDGNVYLIEGNITPGLIWFNAIDERKAKKLMRVIIDSMKVTIREKGN